jgi:hypothetical protein
MNYFFKIFRKKYESLKKLRLTNDKMGNPSEQIRWLTGVILKKTVNY